jgi:PTH1 family peptidyl-tRNA hydrolase
MMDRYLIVGLGNPGREYAQTRHNIGFRCVDAIAAAHGLAFTKRQSKALVADGLINARRVLLVKPQTYMNLSGEAVRGLLDFYKIPLEDLLAISDDMDLPIGTLRIREKGGAGGQKGLKSLIEHLGTRDFARMRIGIGRPPGRMDPMDYVLQDFGSSESILVIETLDRAVRAVETWLHDGLAIAMTRHNGTADEAARNATALPTSESASSAQSSSSSPSLPPTKPDPSD